MNAPGSLSVNGLAGLAAAIGDPARAAVLTALMGGMALTAGELSRRAGVTPPTTSSHLARLKASGLVVEARQGRHRYYALASSEVASMLESLMVIAARDDGARALPGPRDDTLRRARTCYDHIAGRAGVSVAAALETLGVVELQPGEARLTERAANVLERRLGLSIAVGQGSRPACRACMDWSERRPHLAGRLGAALLGTALQRGWLVRNAGSRALDATRAGRREMFEAIGIDWTTL